MLHEAHAVTQDAERLDNGGVAGLVADEGGGIGLLEAGNFAQHGHRRVIFHLTPSVNGHVHLEHNPQNGCGYQQTYDEGYEHDDAAPRAHLLFTNRSFDYAHIGLVDGLLQGHLLTLVEQVSVECLLERLLALYVKAYFLLLRCARYAAHEHLLVGLSIAELHFKRLDHTLGRGGNGCTHLLEFTVEFTYQCLLLAGVPCHAVAVVEQAVVFSHLCVE